MTRIRSRTALAIAAAFPLVAGLVGCSTSDGGCAEYATPADALLAADAVYSAVVTEVKPDERAFRFNTTAHPVIKGDLPGIEAKISLPECAGELPDVGDDVVVFLSGHSGDYEPLRGTPGMITTSPSSTLPTSWP